MEDIPRDIQRDVTRIGNTPTPKRNRRWTLLFVGDNGEVITFRRFKAWAVFYFTLLAAALAAAGTLWFASRSPRHENRRLARELLTVREQLAAVKAEKDLMMARMVVSASRKALASEAPAPEAPQVPAAQASEEKAPKMAKVVPATPGKVAATGSPGSVKTPAPAPVPQAVVPTPTEALGVDVEDLRVTHDVVNHMMHAQFMLKKVDADQGAITGRTFVILKEKAAATVRWLPMPAVPLEEGRPSQVRNGRYFSISRFNIVKFSTPYDAATEAFNNAAVLVYSLQGELLMEKSFDIRVAQGPPPDQDIGE
ncbi:MAG: hypothetical protein ABIL58_19805 [Pseudomonadota bacterium]